MSSEKKPFRDKAIHVVFGKPQLEDLDNKNPNEIDTIINRRERNRNILVGATWLVGETTLLASTAASATGRASLISIMAVNFIYGLITLRIGAEAYFNDQQMKTLQEKKLEVEQENWRSQRKLKIE